MHTTDYLAVQIDTIELASTDGRAVNSGRHLAFNDTQGCPCDDCPHRQVCKEQQLACELFRRWAWSKKHAFKGEALPRIPKKAIYQKLWRDA